MLRLETETGWWLITHPDHARLAGAFAEAWGNAQFCSPEPRARVLRGIASHDDGWMVRDADHCRGRRVCGAADCDAYVQPADRARRSVYNCCSSASAAGCVSGEPA